MEQNKLENQFRKKLNSREINPTAQSWDRLDAMLTVAEKPKKKHKWLFIAASFIGVLLVGTIFFIQNDDQIAINSTTIVNQNTITPKIINTKISKTSTEIGLHNSDFNTKRVASNNESKIKTSKIKKENNLLITNNNANHEKLAKNSIINQKNEQKIITEKAIIVPVDERITVIVKPSKNEILLNQKSTIKIDASSLLSQVDGELELSFREKVINTVAKNYKEVKVAVNNRNNE
jgi:hypothetical protein